MKTLILKLIVALMIMQTVTCEAAQYYFPLNKIEPMIGNWYDSKGNLELTIKNGYTINDCKVLEFEIIGAEYFGSTYKIKILEQTGERDIVIFHHGGDKLTPDHEDYHEFVQVGSQTYFRTKSPRYYESIGGIYLGMPKDKVLSLYDQPSKIDEQNFFRSFSNADWSYEQIGLKLHINGNVVSSITIFPNCTLCFNNSGLSVKDSMEKYKNFYRANKIVEFRPNHCAIYIGHGESFFFDKSKGNISVTLAMDSTYY